MNKEFAHNVYNFCDQLFGQFVKDFEGKEVGKDECELKDIMNHFFEDYVPGQNMKKDKKDKKDKKGKKGKKKLSGYTFFGKQNKEKFNEEIKKMEEETGEKMKYIKFQSMKWKELSEEEKGEWNEKVKVEMEKNNENDGNDEE
tara:strand:- start:914 stop:1342 length:429 start_codon:yes stop_codon:yes gene_type:complete